MKVLYLICTCIVMSYKSHQCELFYHVHVHVPIEDHNYLLVLPPQICYMRLPMFCPQMPPL